MSTGGGRPQNWSPLTNSSGNFSSSSPSFLGNGLLRDALHWGNESLKIMSLQLGQSAPLTSSSDISIAGGGEDLRTSFDTYDLLGGGDDGSWMNGSSSIMLMNQSGTGLSMDANDSMAEPYFPYYIRTTSTLLCGIILFIGIVGNVLVPIVVWRNKELRSSTNIFLVNLSVADLLILLVCMPPVLIELHSKPEVWVLGATMCKFHSLFFYTFIHLQIISLGKHSTRIADSRLS